MSSRYILTIKHKPVTNPFDSLAEAVRVQYQGFNGIATTAALRKEDGSDFDAAEKKEEQELSEKFRDEWWQRSRERFVTYINHKLSEAGVSPLDAQQTEALLGPRFNPWSF